MKTFSITVYGYAPETFTAETKAKARYRAFVAFHSVCPSVSFRRFLGMVSVTKSDEIRA